MGVLLAAGGEFIPEPAFEEFPEELLVVAFADVDLVLVDGGLDGV